MELDWHPVASSRITHEAYDETSETIFVRFKDGTEWHYRACPPAVWMAFTRDGQSRGEFIAETLDYKPHGRWGGTL